MTQELIKIVPNVEHCGSLGAARVYANEADAEEALVEFPNGTLVCCGGFFNAVWTPYKEESP